MSRGTFAVRSALQEQSLQSAWGLFNVNVNTKTTVRPGSSSQSWFQASQRNENISTSHPEDYLGLMRTMASAAHPVFPARPYNNASLAQSQKLPDRNSNQAQLGFGASHTHAARENARLERERLERERQAQALAQQQAQQSAQQGHLALLTDEQRDEINEAFGLFDLDKDNQIDYHEFKVALKALGFDLPKPELLALLTAHGIAPASASAQQQLNPQALQVPPSRLHLTLPAFQSIAAELIGRRDPRDEILRAFNLFDTEGKGMINLEDLRRVARELGEGLEEDELVAMIEEFDLEGKGGVGREEFVGICMG